MDNYKICVLAPMWFNHIKPGAVKILMHMIISFFLLWYIWHILLCEYNRKVSSHCNQSPLFVWWRLVFGNKALVPVDGCFSIVVLLLYSCTLILYIFNSDPWDSLVWLLCSTGKSESTNSAPLLKDTQHKGCLTYVVCENTRDSDGNKSQTLSFYLWQLTKSIGVPFL